MKEAGRLKMAIIYQLSESWINVRTIWQAAKKRNDVECCVILLPFIHHQLEWSRTREEQFLINEGVAYACWDKFDFLDAKFDVVIFTSPYDSTRPSEYSFFKIKEVVPVTVYIPYGLEVGGGLMNIEFQYRQPTAAECTVTFVRSSEAKKMFSLYCPTGDKHVHVSGHPRLDAYTGFSDFIVDDGLLSEIAGRKAVLWNAHFSFTENLWSTFDILARDIFTEVLIRPQLVLIFRPHPLLYKTMINSGVFSEDEIDKFKAELVKLGVIVDERSDHRHAFFASSALLTDAGSFLVEYLILDKPVLYLSNEDGAGLNELGEAVVDVYDQATERGQIAAFLDRLIASKDDKWARRQLARDEIFYGLDGQCGERVLEHITSLFKGMIFYDTL